MFVHLCNKLPSDFKFTIPVALADKNESLVCNYLLPPDLLNSSRRWLQRCRILKQTLLPFPKNTKQMMRLLTFCVLVNSERLLFHKFNFEFKLLLQEIFPLQILNKTALNKNIRTTKCTKSVQILYRQFMPK